LTEADCAGGKLDHRSIIEDVVDTFEPSVLLREGAELSRHPDFERAMFRHTDAALETFADRPLETKLVCQTARYVTICVILYLHEKATADGGAVTVSQLQEVLSIKHFASASWTRLAVRTFLRAGLIEELPPADDRRKRPFRPSPRLLEIGQDALGTMFEALSIVRPLRENPHKLARRPGMLEGIAHATVAVHVRHGFTLLSAFPEIATLLARDYGHLVFTNLIRTMRHADGKTVEAEAPSLLLKRRFGVSRAQVRNVLSLAEEMNLISIEARGGHVILLEPRFVTMCKHWVATDLAWMHLVSSHLDPVADFG